MDLSTFFLRARAHATLAQRQKSNDPPQVGDAAGFDEVVYAFGNSPANRHAQYKEEADRLYRGEKKHKPNEVSEDAPQLKGARKVRVYTILCICIHAFISTRSKRRRGGECLPDCEYVGGRGALDFGRHVPHPRVGRLREELRGATVHGLQLLPAADALPRRAPGPCLPPQRQLALVRDVHAERYPAAAAAPPHYPTLPRPALPLTGDAARRMYVPHARTCTRQLRCLSRPCTPTNCLRSC